MRCDHCGRAFVIPLDVKLVYPFLCDECGGDATAQAIRLELAKAAVKSAADVVRMRRPTR